jgi:hypothetical protein
MIWKKDGDEAVSEVVGNLLILVITVALFSVVLGFVYQIPGPEASIQADIVPMLERTSAVDGTIYLQHTGGETLRDGETYVLVSIDDTPQEFKISDGLPGGKKEMEPGDTWSMDFLGTISTSAKIDVKIIDKTSNSLLFYTVVQRGVSAGGNHDPIIAYAWADTTTPGLDVLPNNDYTTWRIYAVCKDIDGDLPPTGSVSASITSTDNGDGTATVTSFGGGSTGLVDNRGDGVFMTGLLKVSTLVVPGDYTFTITATDDSGRTATASITVTVSTSFSSIRMQSTDEAPSLLKSGEVNKVFLKLEFLANGESINVNQIRVTKLGTIDDNDVWFYCYWDKDRDGVLNTGSDYLLPGWGHPGGGTHARDFVGSPLFTAIEDEPTFVWIVISVRSGTEGRSVGVRIEAQASVTCIGVSTPIRILPIGSFPMDSDVLTIKGVFKVWGYTDHPARILTNTNNVPMIMLRYQATGESVHLHHINITLLGTIAHDQVTIFLRDQWGNVLTPNLPFTPARRCEIVAPVGGWLVDKAWASRDIYVIANILGNNGDTIGFQHDDATQTHAITDVSGDDINPQVPQVSLPATGPIPVPLAVRTLASQGSVSVDLEGVTTMPTRAGGYSWQRRWLFRCYGEPIEFWSIRLVLEGSVAYDEVTQVRIRATSGSPAMPAYSQTLTFGATNDVTFQSAPPVTPMWTVPVNADFYGWIRIDCEIWLAHDTEGKTVRTLIPGAVDMDIRGSITGAAITCQPYGAGDIPCNSYWRTVNGQMYVYGESLIPDPLVDSSQNVPVLKLTFKTEGQSARINSIVIRKLGIVAGNLVTVRIYRDVNNDTTNKIGMDDVELDPTHAGDFGPTNLITFTPNVWVSPGTDYNIIIVFSLNLGTAGWSLGCRVNANEVGTTTAVPNSQSAYPNACLNASRNPPNAMSSATVPIRDRGALQVFMEDLSPPAPVAGGNVYSWMKLTFKGEGEKIDVNRIKFSASNGTGNASSDWTDIRIGIFQDVNNNSVWDVGLDNHIADTWFNGFGEAVFFAAPLFEVVQRIDYNLLVVVNPSAGSEGNFSLNITDPVDIQSKGQVSSLSIPPDATFPLETVEREIT